MVEICASKYDHVPLPLFSVAGSPKRTISSRGAVCKTLRSIKKPDLQTENTSLRGQIRSLTVQIDQIKAELWEKINNLTDKLRGAYESLTNVVKAVGMLKYDREKDQNGNYTYGKYGISNLSKAQDKLIDGLAEYGAKWAKEDGFPEMAEEMEKRVGISKGIEKIIEPQAPKRSHYHDGPSL